MTDIQKFTPTDIVVSTIPSGKTYNLATDRKQLIGIKAEGGLFDSIHLDDDLFGDITFTDDEAVSGRVQTFDQPMIQGDIIAEGQRLKIYQEYHIVQALLLANELVKAGAIEKDGHGVLIFLENRGWNDARYHLRVFRDDDIETGTSAYRIFLCDEFNIGSGVLLRN